MTGVDREESILLEPFKFRRVSPRRREFRSYMHQRVWNSGLAEQEAYEQQVILHVIRVPGTNLDSDD